MWLGSQNAEIVVLPEKVAITACFIHARGFLLDKTCMRLLWQPFVQYI
jgi:hypothetical protein